MANRDRILVVDDDRDTAELLVAMLASEGYDTVRVANAAGGLEAMRGDRFDLVLTDQCMPGQTGAGMLAEARQKGLLDGTAVLVLTANPRDPELAGWRVLSKPVDLDRLVEEVHHAIMKSRPGFEPPRAAAGRWRSGAHTMPPAPAVELVLYVTSRSLASLRARRNLDRLLDRYEVGDVSLLVVDLSAPGAHADPDDRVVFTPTLVKRTPGPRAWLVGDLRNTAVLEGVLDDAGLQRKTP